MLDNTAHRRSILQSDILAMFSRWVGDSQVRVRVRKIGKRNKIIVDIIELSPSPIELPARTLKNIAINTAMCHGIASADHTLIYKFFTERKAMRLDGTMAVTNITEKTFVFSGV